MHSNTLGCAIGRHILDKGLCKKLDNMSNGSVILDEVFELLPDNLKELGKNFLFEIQKLHDNKYNWNADGLSEKGVVAKNNIIQEFNL